MFGLNKKQQQYIIDNIKKKSIHLEYLFFLWLQVNDLKDWHPPSVRFPFSNLSFCLNFLYLVLNSFVWIFSRFLRVLFYGEKDWMWDVLSLCVENWVECWMEISLFYRPWKRCTHTYTRVYTQWQQWQCSSVVLCCELRKNDEHHTTTHTRTLLHLSWKYSFKFWEQIQVILRPVFWFSSNRNGTTLLTSLTLVWSWILEEGKQENCIKINLIGINVCSYLFNCGEGTQRFCTENKVRLARVDHILLTQLSWEHIGGVPGNS